MSFLKHVQKIGFILLAFVFLLLSTPKTVDAATLNCWDLGTPTLRITVSGYPACESELCTIEVPYGTTGLSATFYNGSGGMTYTTLNDWWPNSQSQSYAPVMGPLTRTHTATVAITDNTKYFSTGFDRDCNEYSGTTFMGTDKGGSVQVNINVIYPLTVTKAGSGSGTVSSSPAGISCGSDCSENYTGGNVTLTANPSTGSIFAGWSGACTGTGSCVVSMTQARAVTATFTVNASYTLTVTKSGTGSGTVTSNPSGIVCGTNGSSACNETYSSGTSVTLTANPSAGSTFTGWGGTPDCSNDGGGVTANVMMNGTRDCTATFSLSPLPTVSLTGNPNPVNYNTRSTLTYDSFGTATSCMGSTYGGVLGAIPTSGTYLTVPLQARQGYTFACHNAAGTSSVDYFVDVLSPVSGTCSTNPITANIGDTVTRNATPSGGNGVYTYSWTMTGGTPNNGTTQSVSTTYGSSGPKSATVVITSNGASSATIPCPSVTINPLVNGVCGSAHGTSRTTAPSGASLCTQVTASSVTSGNSLYTWSCAGSGGGSTAYCSATRQYNVTPSVVGSGTITPNTVQAVNYNSTKSFIVKPTAGYTVSMGGTCPAGTLGPLVSGEHTYTTGAVVADCTVVATFTAIPAPTCAPASQSRGVGVSTSLSASGGSTGEYTWSAPGGSPATGSGLSFSTSYATEGSKSVTVTRSGVVSSPCAVNVVGKINVTSNIATTWSITSAGPTLSQGTPSVGPVVYSDVIGNRQYTITPASKTGYTVAVSAPGAAQTISTAGGEITFTIVYTPIATHTLTANTAGTGSGTVNAPVGTNDGISCGTNCTENYNYNTVVSVTQTPSAGSTFTGWSGTGGCTGTGACSITMSAAKTVTATYTLNTYALTVTKAGTGTGTVTSAPAGIVCGTNGSPECTENYNYNTVVTLTATQPRGSTFAGWSGDCTGVGSCSVTMSSAKNVTATFSLGEVLCSPASQSRGVGVSTSFSASGGSGVYSWSAVGGTPNNGSGSPFTTSYALEGPQSVTVTSGTQTSPACTVNVVGKITVTSKTLAGVDMPSGWDISGPKLKHEVGPISGITYTDMTWGTYTIVPLGILGYTASVDDSSQSIGAEGGTITFNIVYTPDGTSGSVDLSADPLDVIKGATTNLAWDTVNAKNCVGTLGVDPWSKGEKVDDNGTEISGSLLDDTTTFTLTCTNTLNQELMSDSVVVTAHTPACFDGIDFDGPGIPPDGFTDYPSDPGCPQCVSEPMSLCADTPPTCLGIGCDDDEYDAPIPDCRDGDDNDNDEKIDFTGGPNDEPADPGCTDSEDDDERNNVVTQCSDTFDNDGDSLIDFPNDPGCMDALDVSELDDPDVEEI